MILLWMTGEGTKKSPRQRDMCFLHRVFDFDFTQLSHVPVDICHVDIVCDFWNVTSCQYLSCLQYLFKSFVYVPHAVFKILTQNGNNSSNDCDGRDVLLGVLYAIMKSTCRQLLVNIYHPSTDSNTPIDDTVLFDCFFDGTSHSGNSVCSTWI